VYFCYRLYPQYVNPFLRFSVLQGGNYNYAPTGIASFGVSNTSPYEIKFSSVAGYFNISCILAYNSSQNLVKPCEASLQLNAVLVVCNENNATQIYWPQDVLLFITNESVVLYHDNVLNLTNPLASLSNSSITSQNGYVIPTVNDGVTQYYYGNYKYAPYFEYNSPFSGLLIMNESVEKGQGVLITMEVEVLQNGTSSVMQSETFDKILIHDPGVKNAYFAVNGKEYTPAGIYGDLGSFYDAELILGGGGNGEITTFEKLNGLLGLYYFNGSEYVTFPSYYTFGADTAEATSNAHVTLEQNGMIKITTGSPDYTYLGEVKTQALKVSPYVPQRSSESSSSPESNISTSSEMTSSMQSSILYIILALVFVIAIIVIFRRPRGIL
jgi:Thermopsin.